MDEKRLAEIEQMAESMEVSARDENIILDLIQALRDERQKIIKLEAVLNKMSVSMVNYYGIIAERGFTK